MGVTVELPQAAPLTDDWEDSALCRQVGIDLFFPDEGKGGHVHAQHQTAKRVCALCPVTDLCLGAALRYEAGLPGRYRAGVWGNATPMERADMDPNATDTDDGWAGEGFTVRDEESTT